MPRLIELPPLEVPAAVPMGVCAFACAAMYVGELLVGEIKSGGAEAMQADQLMTEYREKMRAFGWDIRAVDGPAYRVERAQ